MKQVIKKIDNYDIVISHGYDFESLKEQWLRIQSNQDLPFFLTWSWVSCWLETYNPEVVLVTALFENNPAAIGLLTCSEENRHGFVKSRQYRLHQMGDPLLDQIWMEYNDFISRPEHKISAVNACITGLMNHDYEWDEIIISMMSDKRAKDISSHIPNTHIIATNPCYAVNLQNIESDYLSSLSANTRYQIRRSIRLYLKLHGDLKLSRAQNKQEALDFFLEAKKYHIKRWPDSGYKNNRFIQFHENLIKSNFEKGSIDLIKITSGSTELAILYFHIVNKHVFFYLHGLNYETDKKLKPGLVAHALASQYYLDHGMHSYDYMGGYSQYKCQLASPTENLVSLCIQKQQFQFRIEKLGRRIKKLNTYSTNKEN